MSGAGDGNGAGNGDKRQTLVKVDMVLLMTWRLVVPGCTQSGSEQ